MSANASRGEVALVLDGRTYIAKLNMAACRALQREYNDTPPQQVIQTAAEGSLTHVASLLFHALRQNHPDVTIEQVDGWLDQYGLKYFARPFAELVELSVLGKEAPAGNVPPPLPTVVAAA